MHSSDFSVSTLPSGLRELYFSWSALKNMQLTRCLSDLDLIRLRENLDRITIIEIKRTLDGHVVDFEFLYVSSGSKTKFNRAPVGQSLSSLAGKGPGSQIWAAFNEVAMRGFPLYVSLPYVGPSAGYLQSKEIFLPLFGTKSDVNFVLAGVILVPKQNPPE